MITCLKETGIFIRIHRIVQKYLEDQWKDSAVWSIIAPKWWSEYNLKPGKAKTQIIFFL